MKIQGAFFCPIYFNTSYSPCINKFRTMLELLKYQSLLKKVNSSITNQEKGKYFEDLCEYLFSKIDGVKIASRNISTNSEEIDIILLNSKTDESFKFLDDLILVECKNWSSPVNSMNMSWFVSKLRKRNLKTGIFIATQGFTGDFINGKNGTGAIEVIKSALTEGIRLILISK